MMMEIKYLTNEESNTIQRENFLKLTPVERFYSYLDLMNNLTIFPLKRPIAKNKNFLIEIIDD
jgi:hypothetical protein